MKNLKINISIILTTLILSSCQSLKSSKDSTSTDDPSKTIISTYNGGAVTLAEVQIEVDKIAAKNPKELKGLKFSDLGQEQKESIVKEVVLKEISYKKAKKEKLHKDKEYKAALKIFEEELLKQKLFIHLAKESVKEEKLKAHYDKLSKELEDKKEVRIRYIALKSQKGANWLYKKLAKKPSSFSYWAKKKSIDKDTAKKGGDLGFVLRDQLPTQIANATKDLKKNQVSKPISLGDKWVIIKLESIRKAQVADFESAKQALAQNLSRKALQDFISESLKKAEIKMVIK